MAEDESASLHPFTSLDGLVEFFDTHDMGEYVEHVPEAHFEVLIPKARFLEESKPTAFTPEAEGFCNEPNKEEIDG